MMDERQYSHAGFAAKQVGSDGVPLYTFMMTTDKVDRQGEVVTVDGWDFASYLQNPVVLDSHSYTSIASIVGRCISISRTGAGWSADIRFNDSEYGTLAQRLVDGGDLRAVSVGFRPMAIEYPDAQSLRAARAIDDETMKAVVSLAPDPSAAIRHIKKELLEISVVPIPANSDAVRIRSMAAPSLKPAPESDNGSIAPKTFTESVWPPVAGAMLAVLMDTKTDDAVRRRAYVGLERVYKVLGKNPPDYFPVATVAKLDLPERLGMFWEGEANMIEAKAEMGGISPEITLLKAAYAALEQAEAHQAMAGAAIAQSESLITTVLESLGGILPPESAEPPEGEMPAEDMAGMTEMSAPPATVTYNADVFRSFLEGVTK